MYSHQRPVIRVLNPICRGGRKDAQPRMGEGVGNTSVGKSRALVLGGSIAGLATAAAISQHFDEVTILERESMDGLEVRIRELHEGLLIQKLCQFSAPNSP